MWGGGGTRTRDQSDELSGIREVVRDEFSKLFETGSVKFREEQRDGFVSVRGSQRHGLGEIRAGQADEFGMSTKRNTWKKRDDVQQRKQVRRADIDPGRGRRRPR